MEFALKIATNVYQTSNALIVNIHIFIILEIQKMTLTRLVVLMKHLNMDIIINLKIIKFIFTNAKKIAKFVTIIVYVINVFQHILLIT